MFFEHGVCPEKFSALLAFMHTDTGVDLHMIAQYFNTRVRLVAHRAFMPDTRMDSGLVTIASILGQECFAAVFTEELNDSLLVDQHVTLHLARGEF